MFQFSWLSSRLTSGYPDFHQDEFPHSAIPGSKDVCSSPRLFAAYHGLHRRLLPRHPLCALTNLTISFHPALIITIRTIETLIKSKFFSSTLTFQRTIYNIKYVHIFYLEMRGVEPLTFRVQTGCSPN